MAICQVDLRQCERIGEALASWGNVVEGSAPEYIVPKGVERGSREHACFLFFTANIDQAMMLRRIRPIAPGGGRLLFGAEALWCYSRRLIEAKPSFMLPENIAGFRRFRRELLYIVKWAYPGMANVDRGVDYWLHNARVLLERFDGDPARIPERLGYDAPSIVRGLRLFKGIGVKLSNFIFRLMYKMGFWRNARNAHLVGIPPDIHLQKVALRTGMVKCQAKTIELGVGDILGKVDEAYRVAAVKAGVMPMDLDEPAWHVGRLCCSRRHGELSCTSCPPGKRASCPLSSYCNGRCPLADVCERRVDLKLIYIGSEVDKYVKLKGGISELEDLYPAIQQWIEDEGYGLWMADWPINRQQLDYVIEARGGVVAVEGIVNGVDAVERHASKLQYALRLADGPYIATNDERLIGWAVRKGLGFLLYRPGGKLIEKVKPAVVKEGRGEVDLALRSEVLRAFEVVRKHVLQGH